MAGTGSAPKYPEQRRNSNVLQRGEWVELPPATGEIPGLPEGDWSSESVAYWADCWADPVSSQWLSADCAEMRFLLRLFESQGGKLSATMAGEIRMREDRLGLGLKGKRDLRFRVKAEDEVSEPRKAAGRRRRDLKVVN